MKKLYIALTALLILITIYFICSPYIAVYNIKNSIKYNDPNKLSDNVDFQLLRQNIKDQLNLYFIKTAGEELKDNPFSSIGMVFASKFTNDLVASLITPYGISHLMQGKTNSLNNDSQKLSIDQLKKLKALFSEAHYDFDGINTFTISSPIQNAKPDKVVVFYLKRYGLTWKLTNIEFPIDEAFSDDILRDGYDKSGSNGKEHKMAADLNGNLKISTLDINSRFIKTKSNNVVFVITGKVRNEYNQTRKNICINARLYTKGKIIVQEVKFFCGNILSDLELIETSKENILKRLKNRNGDNMSNATVPPSGVIPFMVVFFELPENLDEFSVEVSGSTVTEG